MTDAPGEWFRKWAINCDASDAEGARWVAEHADAFLIIADCEALSGAGMGGARSNVQLLARRLGAERRGRPVAFVWTKTDVVVPKKTEEEIRNSVLEQIPDALEFKVSIVSACDEAGDIGQGLLDLIGWCLSVHRNTIALPEPIVDKFNPFFLFGMKQQ